MTIETTIPVASESRRPSALVVVGDLRGVFWEGHLPYFDEPLEIGDLTLGGFKLPRLGLQLLLDLRKLSLQANPFRTLFRPLRAQRSVTRSFSSAGCFVESLIRGADVCSSCGPAFGNVT
jgi:hypothetical protein